MKWSYDHWCNLFQKFIRYKISTRTYFRFKLFTILRMSISEILENWKEAGFSSDRKLSKLIFDSPISDASLGPIPVKNVLKPFAMSRYSEMNWPFWRKKSGTWSFCLLDPITSLITDQVFLLFLANKLSQVDWD